MIENLVWWIIALWLLGIVFWIWMFVNLLFTKMKKTEKGLWIIAFLIANFITAIVWFFVRKK